MERTVSQDYIRGEIMPWARGVAVRDARGFVFLSGTEGTDPDTGEIVEGAYEQTRLALKKIKHNLEELGTSLENICHIWYYVAGPDFPEGVRGHPTYVERTRALKEFWEEHCPHFLIKPPAATLLGVVALGRKERLIEILVIAAIP